METSDLGPVAIGDTFDRVGFDDVGGPWEVCELGAEPGSFDLLRGAERQPVSWVDLLDPARWRRVRAL